jgi:hypothetical protein
VPKDKFEPVDDPETFYRDADLVDYYQRALDALDDDDKDRAEAQDRLIRAKRAAAMTASAAEETE